MTELAVVSLSGGALLGELLEALGWSRQDLDQGLPPAIGFGGTDAHIVLHDRPVARRGMRGRGQYSDAGCGSGCQKRSALNHCSLLGFQPCEGIDKRDTNTVSKRK